MERFGIYWATTGCRDVDLTRQEVREMAHENDCKWIDGEIVENGTGKKVGRVYRTDRNY